MTTHLGCMPCKQHLTQNARTLIMMLSRWNVVQVDEKLTRMMLSTRAAPSLQMPPQPAAGGPIGSSTMMRPPEPVGGTKPAKMHGYRISKPRVDVTAILTKLKFRVEPDQWLAMSSVVHQGIVEAVQSGNATPNLKRQVLRQLKQIAGTSTWNSVVSELRYSPASGTKAPTMGTQALQYITPSYPAPTTTWAPQVQRPDNRVLPTYQYL